MDPSHLSQSLPDYVKVRCFQLKPASTVEAGNSLFPADLTEALAGSTRGIDQSTGSLIAADGQCPSLVFAISLDLVWDEFHLHCAIYRALYNMNVVKKLKTKSLPAEVLYQLASTGKINEAIKQFCLKENTQALAVISLSPDSSDPSFDQLCERIASLPQAPDSLVENVVEVPLSEIHCALGTSDKRTTISKVFKLSSIECGAQDFSSVISMRLALKDIEN